MVWDRVPRADALADAERETTAGAAVGVARAVGLAVGELTPTRAVRARAEWAPAKVSMVKLTAATAQITTTTAATARPGWARLLPHRIIVMTCETRVRHTDSARRVACWR